MKKLSDALLKCLEVLAKTEDFRDYAFQADNGRMSFIPYFRDYLQGRKIKVLAKDIVRALDFLQNLETTPKKIKEIIEQIFLCMDERDLKWRTGECDCPRCRGDKKGMAKEFEEAIQGVKNESKSEDKSEDKSPLSSELRA